jgi:hypothetical protein
MRDGLRNWGVLAENVHTEIFGSIEAITPGMAQVVHTPHLPQGPPGSGPPVSFARSGITAAWDPKFASLLELAEVCDVPVQMVVPDWSLSYLHDWSDWRIGYL